MLRPRVRLSVCPSACPSVTSWSSNKTAKRWIKQATPHDSLESSFLRPKILVKFQWVTPNEDVKWTAGKKILRLSTDNSRWLKNGIRQVHTFYERRIGSHIYTLYRIVTSPILEVIHYHMATTYRDKYVCVPNFIRLGWCVPMINHSSIVSTVLWLRVWHISRNWSTGATNGACIRCGFRQARGNCREKGMIG